MKRKKELSQQKVPEMSNENKKDFNAMLQDSKDMPKFQTAEEVIEEVKECSAVKKRKIKFRNVK